MGRYRTVHREKQGLAADDSDTQRYRLHGSGASARGLQRWFPGPEVVTQESPSEAAGAETQPKTSLASSEKPLSRPYTIAMITSTKTMTVAV